MAYVSQLTVSVEVRGEGSGGGERERERGVEEDVGCIRDPIYPIHPTYRRPYVLVWCVTLTAGSSLVL